RQCEEQNDRGVDGEGERAEAWGCRHDAKGFGVVGIGSPLPIEPENDLVIFLESDAHTISLPAAQHERHPPLQQSPERVSMGRTPRSNFSHTSQRATTPCQKRRTARHREVTGRSSISLMRSRYSRCATYSTHISASCRCPACSRPTRSCRSRQSSGRTR